jgi:hypothetical protein
LRTETRATADLAKGVSGSDFGGATGAHYAGDYREHGGIMVPHRRRVYPLGTDNHKILEPVLITIDIARVDFQPA